MAYALQVPNYGPFKHNVEIITIERGCQERKKKWDGEDINFPGELGKSISMDSERWLSVALDEENYGNFNTINGTFI